MYDIIDVITLAVIAFTAGWYFGRQYQGLKMMDACKLRGGSCWRKHG